MAKGAPILLYVAAAGAAGLFIYTQAQKHQGREIERTAANVAVKIIGVHSNNNGTYIDAEILNPNTIDMYIQSFVGTMAVDGLKVADIALFGGFNVKGNSRQVIPLTATTYKNVFQKALSTIKKGVSRINISGTININSTPLPISINYTV